MQAIIVYITFPNAQAASEIAHALLEARLIACANIYSGIESVYRWEGKIETATEVTLIAKSVERHADAIIARVKQLHPYRCPCIVTWKPSGGSPEYLAWVDQETADK